MERDTDDEETCILRSCYDSRKAPYGRECLDEKHA